MAKQQSELYGNIQRLAEMTSPLGEKKCKRCGTIKTLDNFTKKKAYPDGLDPWCRECKREYKKKWDSENADHRKEYKETYNNEHRQENIEYSRKYRELNCEKVRENDRIRKQTDKWKEQNVKYHAKHYEKNRDKLIKQVKSYQIKNPDKVRFYKNKNKQIRRYVTENSVNDFTMMDWLECKLYFDYLCAYCGEIPETLEQDHVIPVTKGGEYTKRNIVPACRRCNNSKKNKPMETWYLLQSFYTPKRLLRIVNFISQR